MVTLYPGARGAKGGTPAEPRHRHIGVYGSTPVQPLGRVLSLGCLKLVEHPSDPTPRLGIHRQQLDDVGPALAALIAGWLEEQCAAMAESSGMSPE